MANEFDLVIASLAAWDGWLGLRLHFELKMW